MLETVVMTENAERHVRVSAEELAGLVRRIGERGDRFLVVQRIPDLPDVFAQVRHEAGGAYTLEHRDGAAGRHIQAPTGRLGNGLPPSRLRGASVQKQRPPAGQGPARGRRGCRSVGQTDGSWGQAAVGVFSGVRWVSAPGDARTTFEARDPRSR